MSSPAVPMLPSARSAARRSRSTAVLLTLLTLLGLTSPRPVAGQAASTTGREPVVLRLHPRVGDTLHTRLEQQTETSGKQGASAIGAHRPMTTSVVVSARTIVQASRATTTTVLTIVDSAQVRSSDARAAAMAEKSERALRGQQLVLQLSEDGSVQSARDARGATVPRDVAEAMAAMPAVFPHRAVSVGERWTREMPLPSAGPLGARGTAFVQLHALN